MGKKRNNQPDARTTALLKEAGELGQRGRFEQGAAIAKRVVQKHPGHAMGNMVLAHLLFGDRQFEQAAYYAERAMAGDPGIKEAYLVLGGAKAIRGQHEDALAVYQRGVDRFAGDGELLAVYGQTLAELNRRQEAAEVLGRAVELDGARIEALLYHANNLGALSRVSEASAVLRRAAELEPDNAVVLSALALMLTYDATADRREVYGAHRAYGRSVEARVRAPRSYPNSKDPERRIRVGLLAGEFRRHSIAYFIEPLLGHHDRDRFHISCYHTNRVEDEVSERLIEQSDGWLRLTGMHNHQIAERIAADRCDVLVELAGHFYGTKLEVMAAGPAPVGVTYLGYANTTGLTRVTARLIDEHTDPAPVADRLASERLVRLGESFLCYRPDPQAPEPVIETGNKAFTFGSFNAAKKMNTELIAWWARLLGRAEGSRLLLKNKGMETGAVREQFESEFGAHGIGADRLELIGPVEGTDEHLAVYNRVDLALDTYPYHGTTTTFEAAWMGVPTVTLVGDRHAARVGLSINENLGLGALCAQSPEHYIEIAAGLANEPDRLRSLRASMRDRMNESALCDEVGFTRRFEQALRGLWRDWCGGGG